ncbi:MAG: mandelate racemase [Chloroflexi bacterium]|nr:mandelate racemase [Chloroflexota bacterium]
MADLKIARVEAGVIWAERPRAAGSNSHMQPLGGRVRVPVVRVTLDDGSSGWGLSRIDEGTARKLVGATLAEAYNPAAGVPVQYRPLEFPVWDLVGKRQGKPVYALAAGILRRPVPADGSTVRCYDTTLYIDDVGIEDDDEGAALMAEEAMQGYRAGHRNFKIKIGRNNVHFPTEAGLRRDIAVVNAIRKAVGPGCNVMADANNGYTYNISRDFLRGTADSNVYWLEEAFYEDAILYRRLKAWIKAEGLKTLIGDGEGRGMADPNQPELLDGVPYAATVGSLAPHDLLIDMVREGIVDVLQWDILAPGLSRWLEFAPNIEAWGRICSPHHYGTMLGNYHLAHLGLAMPNFGFVEWDHASTSAIDTSAYSIAEGLVTTPAAPGFGLGLDEEAYARAVADGGFSVTA